MTAGANVTSRPASRTLIAPAWHTIVFIAIFVGISVVGGFFQHAVKQHPQTVVSSGNAVRRYISVLVFEWLLVLYVRMGVHKRGLRLRDLVGGRWVTPTDVMKDRSWRRTLGAVDWIDESSYPGRRNECSAGTSSSRGS
jgi:hypothetical protein